MSSEQRAEDGFELNGAFYPWRFSDVGKDLMLIDRLTGLPMHEFFEVIQDPEQRGRGPIMLTLIATSIRHAHPDWSVERIYRLVCGLSMSDVVLVGVDQEERDEAMRPPPERPSSTPTLAGEDSRSPVNGSSPSSTRPESSTFETSSASRG
jgi:hypothetical protein